MSKVATLARIGSKVNVKLDLVKDRIPKPLVEKISNDPRGKVLGYKMTDGKGGIGVVIELSDGTVSWFFDSEVN